MNLLIFSIVICTMNGFSLGQNIIQNNANPAKVYIGGSQCDLKIINVVPYNGASKSTQLYRVVWSDMDEYDVICNEIVEFQLTGKMKKNGMLVQFRKMGVQTDCSVLDFRSLDVDPQTGMANALKIRMTEGAAKQLSKRAGIKSVEIIDGNVITGPSA